MKMDKKLSRRIVLVFVVLLMGLFSVSVCTAQPTVPSLISPRDGATLPQPSEEPWTFDWTDSLDLESGIRDTTPLTIIEDTPTGKNVPVTTEITITFTEPMNKESAEKAFSIYPEVSGKFYWEENTLIFTPSYNLNYDTKYVIELEGAMDLAGNSLSWYEWEFTTEPSNNPPNTPNRPLGQNSGYIGTSYSYSTSAEDPDEDKIKYTFDWGDITTSETEFVNSGETVSQSHDWAKPGEYRIRVIATDNRGASSRWSELLLARILAPISFLSISISTNPVPSGESDEIKVQVFSDGDPVPGASIHLTSTIGDLDPEEGKTNYNGEFISTFTAPSVDTAETYTIHAEAEREGQKGEVSVSDLITVTTSPTAIISATPTEIAEGESVSFSAEASRDLDGEIVSYYWDFGDGDTDTGISVEHTYPHSGHYTIALTVTDNDKLSETDTVVITVNMPTLSVSISTNLVPSGESDKIIVQVFSDGNPVAGADVFLSSTIGGLYPTEGVASDDGVFVSTYTAPLVSTTQRYTISAAAEKEGYEEGINTVSDSIFVEQPPTTTPAPVVTPIPTPEETPTYAPTPPPSQPIVPIAIATIAAIAAVTVLTCILKKPPKPEPKPEPKHEKPEEEEEEEEEEQYGLISASSDPDGAVVFLDGAFQGISALKLDNIPIGPHAVVFAKFGYFKCEKEAIVYASQPTPVHCDLTEIPELKLKLSAEPTEITADGKSESQIKIWIEDNNENKIPVPVDVTVELETNIGEIENAVKILDGHASISATLTSSTEKGTATIKARVEFLKSSTTVEFLHST